MLHQERINQPEKIISARCPICGFIVPLMYVFIDKPRWWGKSVKVTVTGDGTDWVAHMWSHNGR